MTQPHLGDYSVVKEIGQGSLGSVLFAEHRFLKRPFVLKVLPEELTGESGFLERFEKEVSALASLNHPHLVKVHNVSQAEGRYFLVSEGIFDEAFESTNLAQYLNGKEKKLSEEEVLEILKQVAAGLDYAHENNVAHRGLKLSNILVRKMEGRIHLYLSDVGIGRLLQGGALLSRTYEALAQLLGTTHPSALHRSFLQSYLFLAPEQKIGGDLRPLDAKADTYAFGVLAYYLLCREFPEGFFELPSAKGTELKANWDFLIYRCLQPDPHKRPIALGKLLEEMIAPSQSGGKPQLQRWSPVFLQSVEPSASAQMLKPALRPQEMQRPEFNADPGAIFQAELTVGPYQPAPQEEKVELPLQTEMVIIPGGTYSRGSNSGTRDEMPKHSIVLAPFAIDIHPVTNEQFVRFLKAMGGEKDSNNNEIIRLRDSRIKKSGGALQIESGYNKHPVVGITWYGATCYAKWVGKRLPTEAEWEIAASCGLEGCTYPTGSNLERSQANFFSADTTAVMSYSPNDFGLFDMAGNVYEWCQDWYDYHYYDVSAQEPNNPEGPPQGVYRVLRGGCWKSLKEDLRCSHRHRNNPGTMNGTYGFRCAADCE